MTKMTKMPKKQKPQTLYTVKHSVQKDPKQPDSVVYTVSKLSEDFEVLALYSIAEHRQSLVCNCPAFKPWCRHCEILRLFQGESKVNTGWFYNYELKTWIEPLKNEA